jgi:hypothetical protein
MPIGCALSLFAPASPAARNRRELIAKTVLAKTVSAKTVLAKSARAE